VRVRVLSLHHPHAALMWRGSKTVETRSWTAGYRGPLGIASTKDRRAADLPFDEACLHGTPGARSLVEPLLGPNRPERPWTYERWLEATPLGVIGSVCELVDVLPMVYQSTPQDVEEPCLLLNGPSGHLWAFDEEPTADVEDQRPFGLFQPGRFAWLTAENRPLEPPIEPPPGFRQGLWSAEVPGGD
jgi:hypothetical protein